MPATSLDSPKTCGMCSGSGVATASTTSLESGLGVGLDSPATVGVGGVEVGGLEEPGVEGVGVEGLDGLDGVGGLDGVVFPGGLGFGFSGVFGFSGSGGVVVFVLVTM